MLPQGNGLRGDGSMKGKTASIRPCMADVFIYLSPSLMAHEGNCSRDPRTGLLPNHSCNANSSKNGYNTFASVTIKDDVNPVEYFFGDEHGTSYQ